MLEEIQALMPILERISDGALWAFVVFMFVNMLDVIVWPLIFLMVVIVAGANLTKIVRATAISEVDLYRVHYKGTKTEYSYIGNRSDLEEFMFWVSQRRHGDGKYVHSSDLKAIMEECDK